MGYSTTRYDPSADKKEGRWKVHPIWRGIGCILIIIMPIIAFMAAQTFMRVNRWVALPSGFYRVVAIPVSSIGFINSFMNPLNSFFSSIQLLTGEIVFTLVFLVLGFGILTVLYGLLYSLIGPPRYKEYDVAPVKSPKRRQY